MLFNQAKLAEQDLNFSFVCTSQGGRICLRKNSGNRIINVSLLHDLAISWVILVLWETLILFFKCFLAVRYPNIFFLLYLFNTKLFFIYAMDQSELKTESECVSGKYSAVFPFFLLAVINLKLFLH